MENELYLVKTDDMQSGCRHLLNYAKVNRLHRDTNIETIKETTTNEDYYQERKTRSA